MKQTHKNPFTQEQKNLLQANTCVKSVTDSTVRFTDDFKKQFYQRYRAGTAPAVIFAENGISPEILGESRIEGFRYTLNRQARRMAAFTNLEPEVPAAIPSLSGDTSVELRLSQVEAQLRYTLQEVEFLKKLQLADMEARQQWESAHLPK